MAHPGWPVVLTAGPITVRPPRWRDARNWSRVRIANQGWLSPWEPSLTGPWAARNSIAEYHRTFARLRSAGRSGAMMPFTVFYGPRLVGQMNVSNIVRGALRSCSVGYWVDAEVAGRGIAPTALALVIDHCLTGAGLHRVEINIRPENAPSLRVVQKLGLRQEGYHERLLDIGGAWRDHLSFAITSEERGSVALLSRLDALPIPPG